VNSPIDSIYLKFCIFHPQVCFVVNRRDRHHSIGYRAISRLTDACGHFIAGLAQAVQMRGPRDLLGNLDDVATRRRGWKIISAVAEWCAWPSPDGNHSSIPSAACMSVVGPWLCENSKTLRRDRPAAML
jgi:hypothetical protein